MKLTLHIALLPFLLIGVACNSLKDQVADSRLHHKWQFSSGEIFYDSALSMPTGRVALLPLGSTYDFSKHNLLYRYMPNQRDTAAFRLAAGDSMLLTFAYIKGELWQEADTSYIRSLTDHQLTLAYCSRTDSVVQWIAMTFTRK
ncbi:hypothetical protein [Paraflavitalea pollutisoli]|uniref:hypothetical protein n=1 Tax=Paraflavitalea pollutisoli TaxID=3034143 RepID=UPI0023EB52C7|nr:hypothetical protein [Paraflavitalea sp. H1-2-19X]